MSCLSLLIAKGKLLLLWLSGNQPFYLQGVLLLNKGVIGQGAFGTVFRVQTLEGQQFALKRIACHDQKRVLKAQLQLHLMISILPHPHLVRTLSGQCTRCESGPIVLVLQQLCDQKTAFDLLENHFPKPVPERQVADGLSAIHANHLIHRDIKLQNIIRKEGIWKICDFGSCTAEVTDLEHLPKEQIQKIFQETQQNTTPMYRAPQMIDPYLRQRVTSKADMWMLGCVLFTLAYGRHPFVNSNKIAILQANISYPSTRSPQLQNLIRSLLNPDQTKRPQAQQLYRTLSGWEIESPASLAHLKSQSLSWANQWV